MYTIASEILLISPCLQQPVSSVNFIHELDKITQSAVGVSIIMVISKYAVLKLIVNPL